MAKKKATPKKKVEKPLMQTVTFKLKSTTHTLEVPTNVFVPKKTAPYRVWYNFWKTWG